jgi:hypothetical protein
MPPNLPRYSALLGKFEGGSQGTEATKMAFTLKAPGNENTLIGMSLSFQG